MVLFPGVRCKSLAVEPQLELRAAATHLLRQRGEVVSILWLDPAVRLRQRSAPGLAQILPGQDKHRLDTSSGSVDANKSALSLSPFALKARATKPQVIVFPFAFAQRRSLCKF